MLRDLEKAVGDIFDEVEDMVSRVFTEPSDTEASNAAPKAHGTWIPKFQKASNADSVVFVLELAGVSLDNVSVSISHERPMTLEVSGVRTPVLDTNITDAEFVDGAFLFRHRLPSRVIPEKTSAKMLDGRLILRIPRERQINIRVGRA